MYFYQTNSLLRDLEIEYEVVTNKDKKRFYIGGQSGFKWRTESANKTWVENVRIIKENKGKKLSNK